MDQKSGETEEEEVMGEGIGQNWMCVEMKWYVTIEQIAVHILYNIVGFVHISPVVEYHSQRGEECWVDDPVDEAMYTTTVET